MRRRTFLTAAGGAAASFSLGGAATLLGADPARAATFAGYAMVYFTESPSMSAAASVPSTDR